MDDEPYEWWDDGDGGPIDHKALRKRKWEQRRNHARWERQHAKYIEFVDRRVAKYPIVITSWMPWISMHNELMTDLHRYYLCESYDYTRYRKESMIVCFDSETQLSEWMAVAQIYLDEYNDEVETRRRDHWEKYYKDQHNYEDHIKKYGRRRAPVMVVRKWINGVRA